MFSTELKNENGAPKSGVGNAGGMTREDDDDQEEAVTAAGGTATCECQCGVPGSESS
jgi:hypothetical protein